MREAIEIRIAVDDKKPLRPRGQEGCVWLESESLFVRLPKGPRFASESLDADTQ